jgi:predicted alpha/beta hydrolase
MEILVQDTTFPAADQFRLAATVFTPATPPHAAALISSATAVPRKIYRGFATYLAERGFAAMTYDYRGIGGSRPSSLKGFTARMRDWATLDVTGAIDHLRSVWPRIPLCVVGHSFGGQAVGLVANNGEIARALLVASQSGYWRRLASPEKYRVYVMMRLLGSAIAHAKGYVPGRLGIGEDVPKGVFLEWTGWCMQPGFFFDDPTFAATANFPRYRGPLRAVGMDDDPWATPAAIDALVAHFTGTQPERRQIDPRGVGAARIGHFGFFRPDHRDTLWREAADWLTRR